VLKKPWLPFIASYYHRIPSRRDIVYAYLACLFPIQVWATYNLLHEVPAWSIQMSVWDLIGVVSYPQIFALLESIIIFIPLVFFSIILPPGWFKDKFIALSTGIVLLSAIWSILAQINELALRYWGFRRYLPWIALFFFSQILFLSLIHYSQKLESVIVTVVERLMVLSVAYLFIDLLSVIIVVIRNI
jgi:hypothetical protein